MESIETADAIVAIEQIADANHRHVSCDDQLQDELSSLRTGAQRRFGVR
jgi:hypothetical protein